LRFLCVGLREALDLGIKLIYLFYQYGTKSTQRTPICIRSIT
jgi:hypothetical protein